MRRCVCGRLASRRNPSTRAKKRRPGTAWRGPVSSYAEAGRITAGIPCPWASLTFVAAVWRRRKVQQTERRFLASLFVLLSTLRTIRSMSYHSACRDPTKAQRVEALKLLAVIRLLRAVLSSRVTLSFGCKTGFGLHTPRRPAPASECSCCYDCPARDAPARFALAPPNGSRGPRVRNCVPVPGSAPRSGPRKGRFPFESA